MACDLKYNFKWKCDVVIISSAQFHPARTGFMFSIGLNAARGVS